MGNCLITQLKQDVNNDNLSKLNAVQIYIENANNSAINLEYNIVEPASKIEVSEGLSGTDLSTPYPKFTGTGILTLNDKYEIQTLNIYDKGSILHVDDLEYCTSLIAFTIGLNMLNGDFSRFSKLPSSLTTLYAYYDNQNHNDISGNISSISHLNALTTLQLARCKNIKGTMSQLATFFPNLTSIGNIAESGFSGSIEDFVAIRRGQGVNEGAVATSYGNYSDITFNGAKLTGAADTPFTWTASTITYNGVTINA